MAIGGVSICLVALVVAARSSILAFGICGAILTLAATGARRVFGTPSLDLLSPPSERELPASPRPMALVGSLRHSFSGVSILSRSKPRIDVPTAKPIRAARVPPVDPLRKAAITPERPVRKHRLGSLETWATFGPLSIIYIALGALLAFRFDSFNGDAQARLANAYYMLFSRDPHLAAIGFVWNPLPSFVVLPLLAFKSLWPPLASRAFAGNIMSALFMAGSAVLLNGTLADMGVRRPIRWTITALYGLNPMILYYGANAMSEGLFLFTLLLATRHLARWLHQENLKALIVAGSALGVAYLARNEAVFAAVCGGSLVSAVAWHRARGPLTRRLLAAATDCVIFCAPFAVAFVGWAVTSWVIVGSPFQQFSSIYGTSSQLKVMNQLSGPGGFVSNPSGLMARELVALSPGLLLIAVVAMVQAARNKDVRFLAAPAILGAVLAFAVLAFLAGKTAGWFRYYLTELPLASLMVGGIMTGSPLGRVGGSTVTPRLRSLLSCVAATAVLTPAVLTCGQAMMDLHVGREEALHLEFIAVPDSKLTAEQIGDKHRWADSTAVARYLDRRRLAHGSVLVDNFSPCVPYMILGSHYPEQFVIPNDRDYQRVLADPPTFHASYFLVPAIAGFGALDAVNRAYPTMYTDGAGIATLVNEFRPGGCPPFRLYQLKAAALPSTAGGAPKATN